MSNAENLVSLADRTTDEKREIGKMGGIASGKARRQKKALKECLEVLLAEEFVVDGEKMDGATGICFKLMQEALKGNIRAFLAIRDTIGETPITKVSVTNDVSQEVIDEIEQIVSAEM